MDGTGTVPILQKAINVQQKISLDFNHTKDKKNVANIYLQSLSIPLIIKLKLEIQT